MSGASPSLVIVVRISIRSEFSRSVYTVLRRTLPQSRTARMRTWLRSTFENLDVLVGVGPRGPVVGYEVGEYDAVVTDLSAAPPGRYPRWRPVARRRAPGTRTASANARCSFTMVRSPAARALPPGIGVGPLITRTAACATLSGAQQRERRQQGRPDARQDTDLALRRFWDVASAQCAESCGRRSKVGRY